MCNVDNIMYKYVHINICTSTGTYNYTDLDVQIVIACLPLRQSMSCCPHNPRTHLSLDGVSTVIFLKEGDCWLDWYPVSRPLPGLGVKGEEP